MKKFALNTLAMLGIAFSFNLHANTTWVPIITGDITIMIPYVPSEAFEAPSNVLVSVNGNVNTLTWNNIEHASRYEIGALNAQNVWVSILTTDELSVIMDSRFDGYQAFRIQGCTYTSCVNTGEWSISVNFVPENIVPEDIVPDYISAASDPDTSLYQPYFGSLRGKAEVNANGSAQYTVPIIVPPGTAGMSPKLTLKYNNRNGNGLTGLGWSLSGLSAIRRCDNTLAQDGIHHSVDFSEEDKYCLDGERLISISGTYGADGTEYRTEVDQFSKILSYGSATDGGPMYFIVETKGGEITEYGNSTDSHIEVHGFNLASVWAVNKVSDTVGNYQTFTYSEATTNGEFYPTRIDYSGNDNLSLSPYNSVTFSYDVNREDIQGGYSSGAKISTSKLLNRIKTYAGSALVKSYQLAYTATALGKVSRLSNITECDGLNNCKESMKVSWRETATENNISFEHISHNQNDARAWREFPGDFNGDGRMDILWNAINPDGDISREQKLSLSNGDGTFQDFSFTLRASTASRIGTCDSNNQWHWLPQLVDLNSDGLMDIHWSHRDDYGFTVGDIMVYLSKGDGTFDIIDYPSTYSRSCQANGGGSYIFGDFNGDSLPDRQYFSTGEHGDYEINSYIRYGNGDGTFTQGKVPTDDAGNWLKIKPTLVDFNGDGLTDIIGKERIFISAGGVSVSIGRYRIYLNLGNGTFRQTADKNLNGSIDGYIPMVGDFNGDNVPDILWNRTSNAGSKTYNLLLWLGKGDGTFDASTILGPYQMHGGAYISGVSGVGSPLTGDFNGDGTSDILWYFNDKWDGPSAFGAIHTKLDLRVLWLGRSDGTGFDIINDFGGRDNEYLSLIGGNFADSEYEQYIRPIVGDFSGNGLADISWAYKLSKNDHRRNYRFWKNTRQSLKLSDHITDSNGNKTSFDYASINNNNVYTVDTDEGLPVPVFPEISVRGSSLNVVSQITIDNGIGGKQHTSYQYQGLRIHTQGLASLGFAKVKAYSLESGIKVNTSYRQDFPYIGLPSHIEKTTTSGLVLSSSESLANYLQPQGTTHGQVQTKNGIVYTPVFPYIEQKTTVNHKRDNNLTTIVDSTTEVTALEYDLFGNPTTTTVTVNGDDHTYRNIAVDTFGPTNEDRRLGRLTQSIETATIDNATDTVSVLTTAYTYHAGSKLLATEHREPNAGRPLELKTSYGYDDFGNQTTVTLSGAGVTTRINNANYDDRGQFITSISNALNQSENQTFEATFGNLIESIDVNNVKTCYLYDGFGRQRVIKNRCGTNDEVQITTDYYHYDNNSFISNAFLSIETKTLDAVGNALMAPNRVYYDQREREIRSLQFGFNGDAIITDTEYDNLQRIKRKSEPYIDGQTSYWTQSHYDEIGRIFQVDYPSGDLNNDGNDEGSYSETFTFSGYQTSVLDAKARTKSVTKDAMGRTGIIIEDVTGLAISTQFSYDSRGNLTSVVDAAANTQVITYDRLGRKIASDDPDMGHWSYSYNAFGELISQTDANLKITSQSYDKLGRIKSRTDTDGNSRWLYDQGIGGIGRVYSESGPQGTSKVYNYDIYSRLINTTTNMGALNGNNQSFVNAISYDLLDRQSKITYPETSVASALTLNYHYNQHGYLHYITDDTDDSIYWIARAVNARGQLTSEQSKNGVSTVSNYNNAKGWLLETRSETITGDLVQQASYNHDKLGNILTRQMSHRAQDSIGLLSQAHEELNDSFSYDGLDRIRSNNFINSYNDFSTSQTYNYDDIGNITYKSDVGNYSYTGSCNGIMAGPHAVTQASTASYCYDRNGNMVSGNDRAITYTAFNKPSRITNRSGSDVNFYYGAARSRLIKRNKSATTYYVGIGASGAPLYEKVTDNTGDIDHLMFIYAGSYHQGQPFAQLQVHQPNNGTDSVEQDYLHRDHLGSVTAITDQSALFQSGSQIKVKIQSYDVWGKNRATSDINQVLPLPSLGNLTYTGQENVPEVGLIHMNGRVYDPILGKMLSADPTIPDPSESASYNRYAYVNNNPMRYSDPTGFEPSDAPTMETIEINGGSSNEFIEGFVSGFLMSGGGGGTDIVEQAIAIIVSATSNVVAMGMQTKKKSSVSRRGGNNAWGLVYQAPQLTNSGSKFENGKESASAQKGNPATGIANKATQDGRLTLGEANEVWRANNDPSFELTVDASQLTVLQTSEFNHNGIASGRIPYSETGDWLVHGSVTLSRDGDGVISIRPGGYDFQPHTPVRTFMTGVRNVETYGGFYVASRAGFSVGTDYLINYSGSPNVVR